MTLRLLPLFSFFFFNDTATTEIYPLSLHDALPISTPACAAAAGGPSSAGPLPLNNATRTIAASRSEEHTSELQSRLHLVCRLLLEKKKKEIIKLLHMPKLKQP